MQNKENEQLSEEAEKTENFNFNDILIIDLKKDTSSCSKEEENWPTLSYLALGYYDRVDFRSFQATAKQINQIADVPLNCQRVVLIPAATKNEEISSEEYAFGAVTFFIINEGEIDSLFAAASQIENLLNEKLNPTGENSSSKRAIFQSYVTANASAIAVISLPKENEILSNFYSAYFSFINSSANEKNILSNILNSYTTFFFSPSYCNKHEKTQNDKVNLCMTIARKSDKKYTNFENFLEEIFEINLKNSTSDGRTEEEKVLAHGSIPGTDDYILFVQNFPLEKLVSTLQNEKEKIKEYCHSIHTTIVFNSMVSQNASDTLPLADDPSDKTGNPPETRDVSDLSLQLRRFDSLKDSLFTKWAFISYNDIVKHFIDLYETAKKSYDESIELSKPELYEMAKKSYEKIPKELDFTSILNKESQSFFGTLSDVLESLLDTGIYFSLSPGYQNSNFNTIPRISLCYQKKINDYVAKWDKANGREGRKHLFLLAPQNAMKVEASMYFHDLPPVNRLINIKIPIQQAYQPELILPFLLHEAGHYIGVRHRKKSEDNEDNSRKEPKDNKDVSWKERSEFFIELTLLKFFKLMLSYSFGKKNNASAKNLESKDIENHKELSLTLASFHQKDLLYKHIFDSYELAKKELVEKNHEIVYPTKDTIKNNYFSEMKKLVTHIYRQMLKEYPHFISEMQDSLYSDVSSDISLYERFKKLDQTEIKKNGDIIQTILTEIYNPKNFITESEDLLSEVAADVFMVRTCEMNRDAYLCLVFEQLVYETNGLCTLLDIFKQASDISVRTLAIWNILRDGENSDFKEARFKIIEEYAKTHIYTKNEDGNAHNMKDSENDAVKNCYEEFKKRLQDQYHAFENAEEVAQKKGEAYSDFLHAVNPYFLVRDYVKEIYNDDRYENLNENTEVGKQAKNLRKIYSSACERHEKNNSNTLAEVYRLLYEEEKDNK